MFRSNLAIAPSRHPAATILWLSALILVLAPLGACGGETAKAPSPKTVAGAKTTPDAGSGSSASKAPAADASSIDVSLSPIVPSPISGARKLVSAALDSPKSISRAVEMADQLTAFAQENPESPDALVARAWSVRFRLLAVGSSAGLQTGPAARALGGDGAQARQMRLALKELELVERKPPASFKGLDQLAVGVRALLGGDPDEKTIEFDRRRAMELALGTTAEGAAIRSMLLIRFEQALRALHDGPAEKRFFEFARQSGRVICAGCSDAHHVTPENVSRFLLNPKKNMGGLLCDEAFEGGAPAGDSAPGKDIGRLKRCAESMGVDPAVEDNAWWGANTLALATMSTAHRLVAAPISSNQLEAPIRKRVAATRKLLERTLILPTPLVVGAPLSAEDGSRPAGVDIAGMVGLGFGGLMVSSSPLELYSVTPKGVTGHLRTVVGLDASGRIVSHTAKTGRRVLATAEVLEKAKRTSNGGLEPLVEPINSLRKKATALAKKYDLKVAKGDEAGAIAEVVVDPQVSASRVTAVLETLRGAGYAHFRFTKTTAHGRTLPLIVRSLPEAAATLLKPAFKRPMIADVKAGVVDIWMPKGPNKDVRKLNPRVKIPDGVELGYRGKTMVRIRVSNEPSKTNVGLSLKTLVKVQKALQYIHGSSGASPLLHVRAGSGALAADVIRVARAFEERYAREAITEPVGLWPETVCGGKNYVANRRRPEGCPTGAAVVFSRLDAPSSRGISSKIVEPKKKKKAAAKPVVKPPEAKPAAGFCDKGNIRSTMNRKRAAFRFCYEKQLRLSKGIAGRVVLGFTIGLSGSVKNARVKSSSLKNAAVHQCLLQKVKTAKFKKPEGGVCQVNWPLKFQPR